MLVATVITTDVTTVHADATLGTWGA